MKVLTTVQGNETFQVKVRALGSAILGPKTRYFVKMEVLTEDQQKQLYWEEIELMEEKIAINYANEFYKSDAQKLVNRYLRYRK